MVDTLEATLRLSLRVKVELLSLFQKTKQKKGCFFRDSCVVLLWVPVLRKLAGLTTRFNKMWHWTDLGHSKVVNIWKEKTEGPQQRLQTWHCSVSPTVNLCLFFFPSRELAELQDSLIMQLLSSNALSQGSTWRVCCVSSSSWKEPQW